MTTTPAPPVPTAHLGYQPAGRDELGRIVRERYHAVADQPVPIRRFAFGDLIRAAGQALCGAAPVGDCPPGLFPPQVTCPACRAIAAAEHVQIGDNQ